MMPSERRSLCRILDVNFNRAREALRVLEDVCRFGRTHRATAIRCKQLRRALADLARPYDDAFLAARDTDGDIGRDFDRAGKTVRDAASLVRANGRRLQESLRSIEEHGRRIDPDLSNGACRFRFVAYRLEREIGLWDHRRRSLAAARVYVLISTSLLRMSLDRTVREAVRGGADVIQLRAEGISDRELLRLARRVRALTRDRALFIVNNRADITLAAEADGVHLGATDMTIAEAREILGEDRIIGATTHHLREARRAMREGADYLSVGPVYSSPTKPGLRPAGLAYVRQAVREMAAPWFAVGGITPRNLKDVVRAGARRIAVCSAVTAAKDPARTVRILKRALRREKE